MMIKLSKFNWILCFALPLFFMACGDDDTDPAPQSIVEIATSDDQFSTLVSALERVDLVSFLQENGPFTVFAPNNAAFTAANIDLSTLSDEELEEVLLYHMISGVKIDAASIQDGQTYATTAAKTGPGDNQLSLLIEKSNGAVSLNKTIKVSTADVEASNGVIHIIDNLLLPLDVVGHAQANDSFTELVTSLGNASLVSTLQGDGPFTVFAPLNSAFTAITSTTENLTTDQLSKVLLYHVVSGNNRKEDLSDGAVMSLNDETTFTVDVSEPVTITDAEGNTSEVVLPNVQATNGVIHVLNAVIIPGNL